MFRLFTEHARGAWVVIWPVLAIGWLFFAFQLTGIWIELGAAQSSVPGETLWLQQAPWFTPAEAQTAFDNIRAEGAEATANAAYILDFIFIPLALMGTGAPIAFGLRQLGWARGVGRFLLLAPYIHFFADGIETALIAAAFSMNAAEPPVWLTTAGTATAIKMPAYAVAAGLAAAGLVIGTALAAFKRADKALRVHD
ncbi:MAG: hypothetical protein PVI23_10410 [Maricaulaceae bacterium]|jgi:hypothetical protein